MYLIRKYLSSYLPNQNVWDFSRVELVQNYLKSSKNGSFQPNNSFSSLVVHQKKLHNIVYVYQDQGWVNKTLKHTHWSDLSIYSYTYLLQNPSIFLIFQLKILRRFYYRPSLYYILRIKVIIINKILDSWLCHAIKLDLQKLARRAPLKKVAQTPRAGLDVPPSSTYE